LSGQERRFTIQAKSVGQVEAVMTAENPKTAEAFWNAMPIKQSGNRWGDEIYFSTSVSLSEENSRAEVEIGSVAYWPPGKALCIFFGSTPASRGDEPRAASPVNVFAKVVGDTTIFKKFRDGDQVSVVKSSDP
jgi:uncharacterized protein